MREHGSVPDSEVQFRDFYSSMVRRVRGFLRRRLDAQDVDDAVEEVFLVVWRRWDDLPPPGHLRERWVFAVARRITLSAYRRVKNDARLRERIETTFNVEQRRHQEEPLISDLAAEDILALLPSDQANLVRRAVIDDTPIDTLATELGITRTALTSRLHRTRLALRSLLSDQRKGKANDE